MTIVILIRMFIVTVSDDVDGDGGGDYSEGTDKEHDNIITTTIAFLCIGTI